MARARNIKPGFFKNEQLVELPFEYRLLFAGLWTLADREGYLEDRPKRIKMEVFPGDDVNIEKGLDALAKAGLILRYEAAGDRYIHIIKFLEHQHPHHKEPPSTIPKPGASPGLDGHATHTEPRTWPPCKGTKPGASPGQARGEPQSSPGLTRLIPDSLNLIPDSPSPHPDGYRDSTAPEPAPAGVGDEVAGRDRPPEPPGDPPPAAQATPYGLLAAELRRRGVRCTGSHPELIALVDDGFTTPEIVEALGVAAMGDAAPNPMNVGYLAKVTRTERAKAAKPARNREPAWWASESATEAKAREVGCWPARPAESWDQLRARIRERIAKLERAT